MTFAEMMRERRPQGACKGLLYLADNGYLSIERSWVGQGADAQIVTTIMFPGHRGRDLFVVNFCPICGSEFTKRDGETPRMPNCKNPAGGEGEI